MDTVLRELLVRAEAGWGQERMSLETAAELRCYQALEAKWEKWEAHESRMLVEITELKAEATELKS